MIDIQPHDAVLGARLADERLVRIYTIRGGQPPYISLQPDTYLEVEEQARSFASIAGQRLETLGLSTPDGPIAVDAMGVTAGWRETVGVRPQLVLRYDKHRPTVMIIQPQGDVPCDFDMLDLIAAYGNDRCVNDEILNERRCK